jgi:hypothetical protein
VTGEGPPTLVWIAPAPPDAAQQRAVAVWARARGLELAPPRDERPPAIPLGLSAADAIEDLLDRARDATAARDAAAVDRATAAAESLLRAHPELPQAAWLMAEVERARSTRWRRIDPSDPVAAERDAQRADALDGGRVPGLGEVTAATPAPDAQLEVDLPDDAQAWLDGRPLRTGGGQTPILTRAGLHALVVTAGGAPVWAEWIELGPGRTAVDADAPRAPPCSSMDAGRARLAGQVLDARGVRCARWIAVAPGPQPGSLEIALCEASQCGALFEWHEAPAWSRPPPVATNEGAGRAHAWPAWATWTLAGATAVGVGVGLGLAVAASGTAAPPTTRFVTGGLKNQ